MKESAFLYLQIAPKGDRGAMVVAVAIAVATTVANGKDESEGSSNGNGYTRPLHQLVDGRGLVGFACLKESVALLVRSQQAIDDRTLLDPQRR